MTLSEKIARRNTEPPVPLGKPKSRGLVLSNVKADPVPVAALPAPDYYEQRSLALPEGEAIELTPVNASPETMMWHSAMNSFASELAITNDPKDPTHSWIAIFRSPTEAPILLHRLQFRQHPQSQLPEEHPF